MKRAILFYMMFCLITPITIEAKKKSFGKGLHWELNDRVLTISGNGSMPDYESPWRGNGTIEKVIIEYGITSIGKSVFSEYDNTPTLRSIAIPSSVTIIDDYAFSGCKNLTSISIPNSVKSIGDYAFTYCENLKTISFTKSVITIGEFAFSGCKKITLLSITNSNVMLKDFAFSSCDNLTSISITNSDLEIGKFPFIGSPKDKNKYLSLPEFVINADTSSINKWGFNKDLVEEYVTEIKLFKSIKKERKTTRFANGYLVEENGKKGIISNYGNWIIPFNSKYTGFNFIGNNYVKVWIGNHYGILTMDGKTIISTDRGYSNINFVSGNGTFTFTRNDIEGICNQQGVEISTKQRAWTANEVRINGGYSNAERLENGNMTFYKISKNNRYGLANSMGKEIVAPELDALEQAGKGYLRFKINGFWGMMNYAGKIIIPTDRGYTKIGDYVSFTKRFPYEMNGFKGECDQTGKQISKISTTTSQKQSVSAKESTPQKQEGDHKIIIEHKHDPVPFQEWQACWACGGMGTMGCDNCGGSGTKYIGDRLHRCSRCNGRGIIPCNVCYGNKGQYITVYR